MSLETVASTLQADFARLYGVPPEQVDPDATFIAMGADSLFLLRASQAIQDRFALKVPFRLLMEELSTVRSLATHLALSLPTPPALRAADPAPPAPVAAAPEPPFLAAGAAALPPGEGTLERLLARQLDLMQNQLEALRGARPEAGAPPVAGPTSSPIASPAASPITRPEPAADLTPRQRRHIDGLIQRLAHRTRGSKQLAQEQRFPLADGRTPARFSLPWKEVCYQITAERAQGGRIWDVNGNEYVDVTMGFGSLLYGHSPDFLVRAVREEMRRGLQLGPSTRLAGEAAELIRELTGVERVAFCNSGTEAVMSALRLARAATGRERIAVFTGSYHGTFDGVLVRASDLPGAGPTALPQAPGIPRHLAEDALVLEFGSDEALEILRRHGDELAAVLIEPRQSRRPGLDTAGFLRELRALTRELGAALIFDEVIVGFRCHPGGAQALFGVEADLVTYGKAVGAGMPIGIVAGKAAYMDAVDGGMWTFGDGSSPQARVLTIYCGTFFKHPWVMAAAVASLRHLRAHSPALQEDLTARTERLATALNSLFEREGAAVRVVHFSSLFFFDFPMALRAHDADLFFYHLLEKGVYVWEGRTCYLSTAHTGEDIEHIVRAVGQTVAEMKAAGFLGAVPDVALPLTRGQKELWALMQMDEGASSAYNESILLDIHGPFDRPALESALASVSGRHGALRASFAPDGSSQRVAPRAGVSLACEDLSALNEEESGEEERGEREARWREAQAATPFDLTRAPLLRAGMLRLEHEHHLLALTLPHLITDGTSNSVLVRDLCAAYIAALRGETPALPPAADYAAHVLEQAGREQEPGNAAEAYWLRQLDGVPPFLELPLDRRRPPVQSYAGAVRRSPLAPELLARLRDKGRETGCTLFTLLLAGFGLTLHRLSGQDDLVVGAALSEHSLAGWQDLMGYFLHVVPLRSRLAGDPALNEHLAAVRSAVLGAVENVGCPLSELARKLDLPRDPSRPALVPVTFNLDQAARPRFQLGEAEVESVRNTGGLAKFEISVDCMEVPGGLTMEWEYRTGLFDGTTIERWMGCFVRLLAGMTEASGDRPVSELPLLTAAEERQIVAEWNRTAAEYPREAGIAELFREQALRTPAAEAVRFADGCWTYAELNERATRLAGRLRSAGVGPETLVGLCLDRSAAAVAAMLAILQAGGAYVPLDPETPAERLRFVLDDAGIVLVVSREPFAGRFAGTRARLLRLEDEPAAAAPPEPSTGLAGALAYVIYTSGSTGWPKGVAVPQRAVVRLVRGSDYVRLEPGDRVAQVSTLAFDAATFEVWGTLLNGAALIGIPPEVASSPRQLARTLRDEAITTLFLTTALFNQVAREEPTAFATLRHLLFGGEAVDPHWPGEVLRRGAPERLLHVYGPTESTTFTTWQRLAEVGEVADGMATLPIGRPIANTRVHVLDRGLRPVPVGVSGELCIGGDGLARGYLGRPELTAERFPPDPLGGEGGRLYRTGDLVRYLPDGAIEFLGRVDNQVKVRGFRIEIEEVEIAIREHPAVQACAVVAREDGPAERRLVAYLTGNAGAPPTISELRSFLGRRLPDYMLPAAVVPLDALPLNRNGKVDRRALPAPERTRPAVESAFAPPVTAAEHVLAAIWSTVLGLESVGIHDNYFEMGGDSILAIQIAARAAEAGWVIKPRQLFLHQTVAELALAAGGEARRHGIEEPEGLAEVVMGDVPLTPIQLWFFEQDPAEVHHFNHAALVETAAGADARLLQSAVRLLPERHDALRLRYSRDGAAWRQLHAPLDGTAMPWTHIDLTALPGPLHDAVLRSAAARVQASLHLEHGPLSRAVFFGRGPGLPGRLLLVVHHLAIDIVSWQILLDELERAFDRLSCGEAPPPARKTTSFKGWAERLQEHARSRALRGELPYWLSADRREVRPLMEDFPGGRNDEAAARVATGELTPEETQVLLHDLPRTFNVQVNDILLTALSPVLTRRAGGPVVLDLEGHGREELFDDVDLTRTLGWFTCLSPVVLELRDLAEPDAALKAMRRKLRSLPNGGIGHGLLRYLSDDEEVRRTLRELPQAQVSFNYLGRSRAGEPTGVFARLPDAWTSPWIGARRRRPYLLELNVAIDDRLRVYCRYSQDLHLHGTVEELVEELLGNLRRLTGCCRPLPATADLPDLSLVDLGQEQLARLLAQIGAASE